jgi:hypothetical protein
MFLLAAFAWLAASGAARTEDSWYPVPRPKLDGATAPMRVVHAINPRFMHMSDAQIEILLAEAARVTKEHLGIDLVFAARETIDIAELFAMRPTIADKELGKWIYDFKRRRGDRGRLVADLNERLQTNQSQLADIFSYAEPYLTTTPRISPMP